MKFIREVIIKHDPSIEELISCFECIKENGDVVVIKFDGERTLNQYTVFVTFPNDPTREMIRSDDSDLRTAFVKVLRLYLE
ncbi:hypothetical protein NF867_16390 [Solitalea sp. MAHUQ-68]|uniref:Uncharacterized protein n=1 Tax=Solitalea agri TaxID=2953739 RepID=A0A9X2JDG4_9SPHI|nr:hypothetical protein [Solitalea agri]MCO4294442.1 hypothetical protein [Solitalea agri]